jgi:hypothetical protein
MYKYKIYPLSRVLFAPEEQIQAQRTGSKQDLNNTKRRESHRNIS